MIPAFDVDPYLIAQYLKAIDMCLTDLLTKMQNVLKHSMFAECFPILDSRNASRVIIKLGEKCMSLARCVIQRDCGLGFHPPLPWRSVGFSAEFS